MSYRDDIKQLLNYIANHPDESEAIIAQLDEKTLQALRTESASIMRAPVVGDTNRVLLMNFINLREKYQRRFTATSFIAFIFRMAEEYEPTCDLPAQCEGRFAELMAKYQREIQERRPVEMLQQRIATLQDEVNEERSPDSARSEIEIFYDLLLARAQLHTTQLNTLRTHLKTAQRENELAQDALRTSKNENTLLQKRAQVAQRKLELRTAYEATDERKQVLADLPNHAPAKFEDLDAHIGNPEKTRLSVFDREQALAVIAKQCENAKAAYQQHADTYASAKARARTAAERAAELQTQCREQENLLSDVRKKFKSTFSRKLDVQAPTYTLDDDEYEALVQRVKRELDIACTREEFQDEQRSVILRFLMEYLRYDPDNHVQCAYKPNYDDALRKPLTTAWRKFADGKISESEYTTALQRSAQDRERMRVVAEREHVRSLIPPDDTFARWQRYEENHYEQIRQATDDIYAEKSDVEVSIVPLEVFEGTPEEIEAQTSAYKHKYSEEFEGDVMQVSFNMHNMLGSWQQNRDRRDFYTKNSEIIKRIIQQSEDDSKMGRRLMQQRTRKQNSDLDAEKLRSYKEATGSALETGGAKSGHDLDFKSVITDDELRDISTNADSNDKEVEVAYTTLRARRRGMRTVMDTDNGKFHIAASNDARGYKMKPEDMRKHIASSDMREFMKSTQ